MKRYLLVFLLLSLTGLTPAGAQTTIVGDFSVTRKQLVEQDGKLVVELEFFVSGNSVTRSTSWMIIPELSTPDRQSVVLFPHIIIEGRYQKHMRKRQERLTGFRWTSREPYRIIDVKGRSKDQTIEYRMEVPYESWMEDASLVIRQVCTHPGNKRRVYTVDVNGAVDHR